jgi:hypothetical protein
VYPGGDSTRVLIYVLLVVGNATGNTWQLNGYLAPKEKIIGVHKVLRNNTSETFAYGELPVTDPNANPPPLPEMRLVCWNQASKPIADSQKILDQTTLNSALGTNFIPSGNEMIGLLRYVKNSLVQSGHFAGQSIADLSGLLYNISPQEIITVSEEFISCIKALKLPLS